MLMKRVLGVMMLVLLACGPSADAPTDKPARPAGPASSAGQDLGALRNSFVWRDASQPAHDWDGDVKACQGRADENATAPKGSHPLVKVAALMKCMDEAGWEFKGKNR